MANPRDATRRIVRHARARVESPSTPLGPGRPPACAWALDTTRTDWKKAGRSILGRRSRRASARPGRPQRRRRGAARPDRRPARERPAWATSATPIPTPIRPGSGCRFAPVPARDAGPAEPSGLARRQCRCDHLRPGAEARAGQGGHPRQPGRAAGSATWTRSTSRPRPASTSATSAGPRRSAARSWC